MVKNPQNPVNVVYEWPQMEKYMLKYLKRKISKIMENIPEFCPNQTNNSKMYS